MKKLITVTVSLLLAATVLAGCSLIPYTCDICGETKVGRKYTQKILGLKVVYCSDCKDGWDEIWD